MGRLFVLVLVLSVGLALMPTIVTANTDNFVSKYHTWTHVKEFLRGLQEKFPDLMETRPIGKTVLNEDILVVKLGTSAPRGETKPQIVLLGGQHAREWISPASLLYLISSFCHSYSTSPIIKKMLDSFEWNIIPILNIDGYKRTWDDDRMMRENMNSVDLNRNWNIHWNGRGLKKVLEPTKDNGPGPWSEPETQTIHNFLRSQTNLALFVDIHSYGQVILEPYAYTCDPPPDHQLLSELGDKLKRAMLRVNQRVYQKEKICLFAADATGSSVDYVYQVLGALSFAIELPDQGKEGFLLPDSQIKPVGKELEVGIITLANELFHPKAPGKVSDPTITTSSPSGEGEVVISWKSPIFKGVPQHSSPITYEIQVQDKSNREIKRKTRRMEMKLPIDFSCSPGLVVAIRAINANGKGEWTFIENHLCEEKRIRKIRRRRWRRRIFS